MTADTTGRRRLTDAELDEMFEHSKNDHWIWVGSDIRRLVAEVRASRSIPGTRLTASEYDEVRVLTGEWNNDLRRRVVELCWRDAYPDSPGETR